MTAAGGRQLPWLALVLVGIAAQLAWMDATVGTYDEGLVLVGADRVLRGDIPYRDFWTLYGPGSFYALAGLYALFGQLALVERGFDIVAKTAITMLVIAVVLQFGRRAIAFAAGALALGLLLYLRSYSAPVFPAVASSLAVMLALHQLSIEARPAPAFWAGVGVAVTTWFRHDLGSYVLLASTVFLLHLGWAAQPGRRRQVLRTTGGWFAAGLAVGLGPVVAFFAASVPAADLHRSFIEIPFSIYPEVRALPFPPIAEAVTEAVRAESPGRLGPLVVYLPLLVMAGAIAAELLRHARLRRGDPVDESPANAPAQTRLFWLLLLLAALFFLKGVVRVSPLHMGPSLLISIVVLCAGVARARSPAARRGLTLAVALAFTALLAKPLVTAAERAAGEPSAAELLSDRWMSHASALCGEPVVPRLRCLRLEPHSSAVAASLVQHGASGRRVYVGVGRHDKILAANLALTFAVAAIPPTRWHDLHPGVQTQAEVQAQMIQELQAAPPAFVVLDHRWDNKVEPNESALSSGVTALDDYLAAHFRPVFRVGYLTVLKPRLEPSA
jgi:hypothetical protein